MLYDTASALDRLPEPAPLRDVPPPMPIETLAARTAAALVKRRHAVVTRTVLITAANAFRTASEPVKGEIIAYLEAADWLIPLPPRSAGKGAHGARWQVNPKALAATAVNG